MYETLSEAEDALQGAALGVGSSKLALVKILRVIQHDKLYVDARNEKDEEVNSFGEYLKLNADTFKRISGMGKQQLERSIKSYVIFGDTLDFPDDILLDMGEHFLLLAEAANVNADLELYDLNGVSVYGGRLLGQQELTATAHDLMESVHNDDTRWLVKDTRKLVDEIIGKTTAESAVWFADSYTTLNADGSTSINIAKLNWTCDGDLIEFHTDRTFTLDEYHKFTKRGHITTNDNNAGF
jgi:hypothetical protein